MRGAPLASPAPFLALCDDLDDLPANASAVLPAQPRLKCVRMRMPGAVLHTVGSPGSTRAMLHERTPLLLFAVQSGDDDTAQQFTGTHWRRRRYSSRGQGRQEIDLRGRHSRGLGSCLNDRFWSRRSRSEKRLCANFHSMIELRPVRVKWPDVQHDAASHQLQYRQSTLQYRRPTQRSARGSHAASHTTGLSKWESRRVVKSSHVSFVGFEVE